MDSQLKFESILRTWRRLPLLLRGALVFYGGLSTLLFLAPLFTILAVFDVGHFQLNEQKVTGTEFLAGGWWFLLILFALGVLSGLIAYGLLTQRSWARECIVAFPGILLLAYVVKVLQDGYDDIMAVIMQFTLLSVWISFAAWYLYFKANVEAYFSSGPGAP
jgi:hypothetical protein